MDYERAQQIFRSDKTIKVLHQGRPVWIKSLDPGDETASVSAGGDIFSVSVRDLVEG